MSRSDIPHLFVTSVSVSATAAVLILDRPLANVGFGREFRVHIPAELLPGGTLEILFSDSSGVDVPARNFRGDLLRADSLLDAAVRLRRLTYDAYLGDDDLHVVVFNRLRRSRFVPTPIPAP